MTPSLDAIINHPETPHARWYQMMTSSGDYVQQFNAGDEVIVVETGDWVRVLRVLYCLSTFKHWYITYNACHLVGALRSTF